MGGKVFLLTLSSVGLIPIVAKARPSGAVQEWDTATPEKLLSHQAVEMLGRRYAGPLLDVHAHISNVIVDVWTEIDA